MSDQPNITISEALKIAKQMLAKMDDGDTTDIGKLSLVCTGLVATIENAHLKIDLLKLKVENLEAKVLLNKRKWFWQR